MVRHGDRRDPVKDCFLGSVSCFYSCWDPPHAQTPSPYTCLIEQIILYVLLVKIKGFMVSLESSSTIGNI